MLKKRLLILANNPLSDGNSNGRTLKNFFSPEDREYLAQIYLQGTPDLTACARFFRVSDGEVLRAFFRRSSAGKEITEIVEGTVAPAPSKKPNKTPFTLLLRNFFWNRKRWRKNVNAWIEEIAPEAILLQAGDSPFLYRWAVSIARERKIPLVIYNSEDYYFKNYDYTRSRGLAHLFYPSFSRCLRRALRAAIETAAISIYNSEDLKNTYDQEFGKPSEYVYTTTEMKPNEGVRPDGVFSYLGNLGVGRHKSLVKIAEALAKIDPSYHLDVYGKIPNEEVAKAFDACFALRYHGLVDYSTVRRIMSESTLLFHAESFEEFYRRDIRHGFSTKIADSLASGTPFVLFAPPELSCTKYLKENECACVIDDEAELETKLREIIETTALRQSLVEKALVVAKKKHDAEKNRAKIGRILDEL